MITWWGRKVVTDRIRRLFTVVTIYPESGLTVPVLGPMTRWKYLSWRALEIHAYYSSKRQYVPLSIRRNHDSCSIFESAEAKWFTTCVRDFPCGGPFQLDENAALLSWTANIRNCIPLPFDPLLYPIRTAAINHLLLWLAFVVLLIASLGTGPIWTGLWWLCQGCSQSNETWCRPWEGQCAQQGILIGLVCFINCYILMFFRCHSDLFKVSNSLLGLFNSCRQWHNVSIVELKPVLFVMVLSYRLLSFDDTVEHSLIAINARTDMNSLKNITAVPLLVSDESHTRLHSTT